MRGENEEIGLHLFKQIYVIYVKHKKKVILGDCCLFPHSEENQYDALSKTLLNFILKRGFKV